MASGQRQNLQKESFGSIDDTTRKLEKLSLDLEEEVLERPDQVSDLLKAASDFRRENVEMETNSPARCSLPAFPVEVWIMILGFLPDHNHVRAAVHSCHYLLSLWNKNRVHVITNMLGMAPGVLEEAACAVNFPLAPLFGRNGNDIEQSLQSSSRGWSVDTANRIRRHNPPFPPDLCIPIKMALSFTGSRNQCLTSNCTFRDVSRLEKIHPAVRKLADIYIKQCAASNPKLAGTLPERPVTLRERVRIERAFYRFEIFRRAFGSFEGRWAGETDRGLSDVDAHWHRDWLDWLDDPVHHFIQEFNECFNTVELIQMHCIYGFLKRLVTPAINDVLWHECELYEPSLVEHWATDKRVSVHVIAGIDHVYNIWAAFNDRSLTRLCCLIEGMRFTEYGPNYIPQQHDTIFYHLLVAELYTRRNSSLEVTKSKIAIHDADEGPRDACLAVVSSIQSMGKKSPDDLRREADGLALHRQWGFVMWDQRRLDMLGFFDQNYASPTPRSPYLSDSLAATSAKFRHHRRNLLQRIHSQVRAPSDRIWWEGALGPAYTLGPRQYNTWYPLAAPGS